MRNTFEKNNITSKDLIYRQNSSDLTIPYNNIPLNSKSGKNDIICYNDISFEDMDKDNISYEII